MPSTRITIGWHDLTSERGTEGEIATLAKDLNCTSALTSLARINILLAIERFRATEDVTIAVHSFLVSNFLDDDVFSQLKAKFGMARLIDRPIFHSQQVLLLARYLIIYGAAEGGIDTEEQKEARGVLGKCLLFVSDLLVSSEMSTQLRNKSLPKPKKAMLLQLSAASGLEVNNPPEIRSSIVRSDALFGEILKRTPSNIDISQIFKDRTGMQISEYLDFNIATLTNYIAHSPDELLKRADLYFLNPDTFFPPRAKDAAESFWNIELGTINQYREELTADTKLASHHNFTAFRKRPFFRTNEVCIPIHPCFVQEKLEAGLFWTIFHTLKTSREKDALFSLWGRLYETYIIESLGGAANGKNNFAPFPKFKDDKQEAFDCILSNGKICIVFECKAGFLRAESKFSEDARLLMPDLEDKFGASKTGALYQLSTNITKVFNRRREHRREIEGIDLANTQIVVPVLVVQEKFVSSPLTAYCLADTFRSVLRKHRLTSEIDCQCQGLIVMDAYDVEALRTCNSNPTFDLLSCIFERSRLGDQVYDFHDFLIDYASKTGISLKSDTTLDAKFRGIMDRISGRLFEAPMEGG